MNQDLIRSQKSFPIAPVALLIFNRPAETRRVIDALRKAKITLLFVVADGPRLEHAEDWQLCDQARAVISKIDWPCEVRKLYRDTNLGCGQSPAQGLAWVFTQVDRCIILEDDCIPNPSFFNYCNELLDLYISDSRIMMISGNNHLLNQYKTADSYLFSINTQTHGWATWRRAWDKYDFYMKDWPIVRSISWLTSLLGSKRYAKGWLATFDAAYQESNANPKCTYWDFQWTYACWKNNALNILPSVNLISNIGYGEVATHAVAIDHPLANLPSHDVGFPLRHPAAMIRSYRADEILKQTVYGYKPRYIKAIRKIQRLLKIL